MSQTLLNHSGLLFLANDNVVTNPASIPAAATVPRKSPPARSLGVGRGGWGEIKERMKETRSQKDGHR